MMTRTLTLVAAVALVATGGQWLASSTAPAASMSATVPADHCVAYLELPGLANQRADWEQTAAYKSMIRSGFVKTVRRYIDRNVIAKLDEREQEMAEWIDGEAEEVVKWTIANGATFGVWFDPATMEQPLVAMMLSDSGTVIDYLANFGGSAPQQPPESFGLQEEGDGYLFAIDRRTSLALLPVGDVLVVTDSMKNATAIAALFDGSRTPVSEHPKYPTIDSTSVLAAGFVDVEAIQNFTKDIRPGRMDEPSVGDVLSMLGVDSVTSGQVYARIDGEAIRVSKSLNTNGSPSGPLKQLLSTSISLEDLPPIPAGTPGFAVTTVEGEELYDSVIDGVAELMAEYEPRFDTADEARAKIEEDIARETEREFGMNPVDTLLPALGNVFCLYDMAGAGPITVPSTLVMSVKDKAPIIELAGKLLDEADANGVAVVRESKDGYDTFSLSQPGVPVQLIGGISDKWAVIGFDAGNVSSFFERAASGEGIWEPTDELLARNPALGGDFGAMSYVDTAQTWQRGKTLLAMAMPAIGAATGKAMPQLALPSDQYLTKPMFPNVTVITGSDDGLAIEGTFSAPSFPGGSTASIAPALLLGVPVAIPAIVQARVAARRVQSKNNLKQLGLGTWNYESAYHHFPQATVESSAKKPSDRLSHFYSFLPFIDQGALYETIDKDQAWNSAANSAASMTRVETFIHPNYVEPSKAIALAVDDGETIEVTAAPTHYIANGGLDLPGEEAAGLFSEDGKVQYKDVLDGLSNTIMYWETSKPGDWAQGGRDTTRALTARPLVGGVDGVGGISEDGFNVGVGDGSVRFLSNSIDEDVLKAMMTRDGKEVIDLDF